MATLIPNRFLFDFEIPLAYRPDAPPLDGRLTGWSEREELPRLGEVDGRMDFAAWWACWNETGLYVACHVPNKYRPPQCDASRYWESDVLRVCTNTREAKNLRRATRFCQQFYFMPAGGGPKGNKPCAGSAALQRAKENAPQVPAEKFRVAASIEAGGYRLEGQIPAEALVGFDPADHPRIGFFAIIEDRDRGQQVLTVGDDLGWYVDPSTWATAVLAK